MLKMNRLDHLVLTVADLTASIHFYRDVLGMQLTEFKPGRFALQFGEQKINLHAVEAPFLPNARAATPGCADLCFLTDTPLADVISWLCSHQISIEEGPVMRTGAISAILSVYCRDPDGNLIEISNSL